MCPLLHVSSHLYSLGPKSPASYTRRSQESASTTPRSSNKPTQPLLEAPAGRKSRFSQADSPTQYSHRQSESRNAGIRRARTDDVTSHSARYVDDVPSTRSMSDVRGDDNTPIHPTPDAQRTSLSHPIQHPSSYQRRLAHMYLYFFYSTSSMDVQDQDQGKGQPCLHRMRCSAQVQGRVLFSAALVILWDLPGQLQRLHPKTGIQVG